MRQRKVSCLDPTCWRKFHNRRDRQQHLESVHLHTHLPVPRHWNHEAATIGVREMRKRVGRLIDPARKLLRLRRSFFRSQEYRWRRRAFVPWDIMSIEGKRLTNA